ncbi:MAG: DUF2007 domain-containing protein [Cocleimonas sp.]
MKKIHTSEDRIYLFHLKNLLEAQEIDCLIKNDRLLSIAGDIPMGEVWPELWVRDSLHEKWAKEIISDYEKSVIEGDAWICKNCGEEHAPQFKDCWNCQAIKGF